MERKKKYNNTPEDFHQSQHSPHSAPEKRKGKKEEMGVKSQQSVLVAKSI
jgi:hypothetical protein